MPGLTNKQKDAGKEASIAKLKAIHAKHGTKPRFECYATPASSSDAKTFLGEALCRYDGPGKVDLPKPVTCHWDAAWYKTGCATVCVASDAVVDLIAKPWKK